MHINLMYAAHMYMFVQTKYTNVHIYANLLYELKLNKCMNLLMYTTVYIFAD
jgi:hypothetical protein